MTDFSWLYDWPQYIPDLFPGLGAAVALTLLSCVGGYILGFFLALGVESQSKIVHLVALTVVELGAAFPSLCSSTSSTRDCRSSGCCSIRILRPWPH